MLRKAFGWRLLFIVLVLIPAAVAGAESPLFGRFGEGDWRVEFTAMTGLHSGRTSREGDYYLTGSVEYGWPVFARGVLGLKAYPLFIYLQDEDEDDDADSASIYGGALGIVVRVYLKKEERRGLYAEAGESALWHSHDFANNASRVNFLTELGVGYEFRNTWHVAVKWEHISNAGLREDNDGVNAVGVAVGRAF